VGGVYAKILPEAVAMTQYKQCILTRKTAKGTLTEVSWLPEKFAVKGSYVKLKNDGVWEDGWLVQGVYDSATMTHQALLAQEQMNKHFGPSIRG
jgi:hypothetical protein